MTLREQAIQAGAESLRFKWANGRTLTREDCAATILEGLLQWLRDNMRAVGLAAFLKDGCSQAEDYDHEDEWYAPASTMQEQPLLDLCDLSGGGETE